LGGKSPTIVGRSADLDDAANKIAIAKATNSGQICVSPTWCTSPEELDTRRRAREVVRSLLPSITDNRTSSLCERSSPARVEALVADARDRGEMIVAPRWTRARRRRRPQASAAIGGLAAGRSKIMQEEIFGPRSSCFRTTRPKRSSRTSQQAEAAGAVLLRHRRRRAGGSSHSHVLGRGDGQRHHDASRHARRPFGGVGASGMGHYHGREGFLEFSHARTVFEAPEHDPRAEWGTLPPYGEGFLAAMEAQVTP
ncbi:aldehyde dehydrogenase family protein, partial [Rhodococcus hoagii]|nr:aldehyde dehydrogenase family protein [Prescottella equi]